MSRHVGTAPSRPVGDPMACASNERTQRAIQPRTVALAAIVTLAAAIAMWTLVSRLATKNAEHLRQMYVGRKGNATARRYARLWNRIFAAGLFPSRWISLEVRGRTSGKPTRFPLGIATFEGNDYLVSMLGECNWVRNVRAAHGVATVHGRRSSPVLLEEVPVAERPPIIKQYLEQVPGGRPHIPVDRTAPVEAFIPIAATYPVFRIVWQSA